MKAEQNQIEFDVVYKFIGINENYLSYMRKGDTFIIKEIENETWVMLVNLESNKRYRVSKQRLQDPTQFQIA